MKRLTGTDDRSIARRSLRDVEQRRRRSAEELLPSIEFDQTSIGLIGRRYRDADAGGVAIDLADLSRSRNPRIVGLVSEPADPDVDHTIRRGGVLHRVVGRFGDAWQLVTVGVKEANRSIERGVEIKIDINRDRGALTDLQSQQVDVIKIGRRLKWIVDRVPKWPVPLIVRLPPL